MELPSLNQIFNSDSKLESAKAKIRDGTFRWEGFRIDSDDRVVYEPSNLTVIPKSEVRDMLKELWEKDTNMLGKGNEALYKYLSGKYINISRDDIRAFLRQQPNYTMGAHTERVVNKPIVERKPNVRWQVDLIDVSQYGKLPANRKKRYIFNAVDVFSRKCWLESLKDKTPQSTRFALYRIFKRAGIKPKIVQVDRGTEFETSFKEFLAEQNVKRIQNTSYSPNQNAIVERVNKEIRKIMRAFFRENENTNWFSHLLNIEENYNNSRNSSLKASPNEVWTPTYDLPAQDSIQGKAGKRVLDRARKQMKRYNGQDNFQPNNRVRVKMSALFSNVRRVIKEGNSKQLVVTHTPVVFEVKRVFRRAGTLERRKYTVVYPETGYEIAKADGKLQLFYASDLAPADGEESQMTMERALKLNGVEPSAGDSQWRWGDGD